MIGCALMALSLLGSAPATLWALTGEATVVVDAVVVERRADAVVLEVGAAWKGLATPGERLTVRTGEPLPEGARLAAFLGPRGALLSPVKERYGLRLLESEDEARQYARAVRTAAALQARLDGPSFPTLSVLAAPGSARQRELDDQGRRREGRLKAEWWMEAAAMPATRWDGLYEVLPMLGWNDPRAMRGALRIRTETLERLAHGFVERPPVYWGLPLMLALLEGVGGREVTSAAMNAFETAFAEDLLFEPDLTLQLLRDRLGIPPPPRGDWTVEDQWLQLRRAYGAPVQRLPGQRLSRDPLERVLP